MLMSNVFIYSNFTENVCRRLLSPRIHRDNLFSSNELIIDPHISSRPITKRESQGVHWK